MKVIKQGNLRNADILVRFDCGKCGCVFQCDTGEYEKHSGRYNGVDLSAICPTCKRRVYGGQIHAVAQKEAKEPT